jgi:DNA polymerase III subunit epsilon
MYAIIDIETTGGRPALSGITEIAIFLHDGTGITNSYQTLINPEMSIPPYITGMTGISDEMVADAPTFAQIASEIDRLTRDCVFVAHNVSFDLPFLTSEKNSVPSA